MHVGLVKALAGNRLPMQAFTEFWQHSSNPTDHSLPVRVKHDVDRDAPMFVSKQNPNRKAAILFGHMPNRPG